MKIINLDTIDSTNNYAWGLVTQSMQDFTFIFAREQKRGRGRRENKWCSPRGGIYTSIIVEPKIDCAKGGLLGLLTALTVVESLKKYAELKIKWPNDLLLNQKKIAGILVETKIGKNKIEQAVIGLGLNVNNTRAQLPENATSLAVENKKNYDIDTIKEKIIFNFKRFYNDYHKRNFVGLPQAINPYLNDLGKKVSFNYQQQRSQALVLGISNQGELVVKFKGKRRILRQSEVFQLR
jgi:BirA family biotin operon repressor/biotin-[acetyl-CoA-carboxylase] ligase